MSEKLNYILDDRFNSPEKKIYLYFFFNMSKSTFSFKKKFKDFSNKKTLCVYLFMDDVFFFYPEMNR